MTRRPKQAPSESYAARASRGRPTVAIAMSAGTAARLRALAASHGLTLGETITYLLALREGANS
jgi:hypothetical protein